MLGFCPRSNVGPKTTERFLGLIRFTDSCFVTLIKISIICISHVHKPTCVKYRSYGQCFTCLNVTLNTSSYYSELLASYVKAVGIFQSSPHDFPCLESMLSMLRINIRTLYILICALLKKLCTQNIKYYILNN